MNKKILFLSIFIFIIGLIGISALLVIDYAVKRRKKDEPSFHLSPSQEKWLKQQQIEHVQITSFDGLMLRGLLIKAKQESDKMVIAIHGYRMNNLKEYAKYLQFYHDAGFHILLPDNRAHGQSEGKYIGFGYLDKFDCLQWIDFVEKQLQKELPKKEWSLTHHLLIFHGRRCCTARNPKCDECPFTSRCKYYKENKKKLK